ncbi:hypothetical protein [Nostoc sp. FACHB-110]|uniref:hypothetical protein n=1 Tax=Nostoc sp. FACHB-110 TaxID=2692834 RepID=UPI001687E77B|nr:hypothetical protein [Nostoc sp. FACHB-110]MBD2438273.1 hypothetical protein [Nostoc sp. FACHB-110]
MADRWLKVNCLLAGTFAFWLSALSPLPKIAKGICYSFALVASVQLVQESRRLMVQDVRRIALGVMNQELEDVEIALHTSQQEQALYEIYGTYPPEVKDELVKSLDHLYREESAEREDETSASTSQKKSLYLAVKSLLEARGETYVIENVLRLGGGQWAKGKQRLAEILEEGEANGW